MWTLPLFALQINTTWYLFPLALVVSLVYNATRYELPERILKRAAKHFAMILFFMGLVFLLLLALSFRL